MATAHINTHTQKRTHKHTHTVTCTQTHTHTHWPVFCSPGFEGKKGKMTSSSSCEANETDEGGGENAGRNRTLLHKTRCGPPPGPVTTSCVCASAHAQGFVRVNRLHGASSKGARSSLRTCAVTVCRKTEHYVTASQNVCNTSHSKEVMS